MKASLWIVGLLVTASPGLALSLTNDVSADALVRAAAPGSNYGGAGALSVSGPEAVNAAGVANGVFAAFLRFNTGAVRRNLNSLLGTNDWVIDGAKLHLTEIAAPNNALFNRGVGRFEIRWIANDVWVEGTGNPNAPTDTGVTYNDISTLLNVAVDATLGTFTNAAADGPLTFPLALPAAFLRDLGAGGDVSLWLTPVDPGIGFTFDSRSFGIVSARPSLEISVAPRPAITAGRSGSSVVIVARSESAAGTYSLLSTTNLSDPLDQWSPVATNEFNARGEFTTTLTNAVRAWPVQFFILRLVNQPMP